MEERECMKAKDGQSEKAVQKNQHKKQNARKLRRYTNKQLEKTIQKTKKVWECSAKEKREKALPIRKKREQIQRRKNNVRKQREKQQTSKKRTQRQPMNKVRERRESRGSRERARSRDRRESRAEQAEPAWCQSGFNFKLMFAVICRHSGFLTNLLTCLLWRHFAKWRH